MYRIIKYVLACVLARSVKTCPQMLTVSEWKLFSLDSSGPKMLQTEAMNTKYNALALTRQLFHWCAPKAESSRRSWRRMSGEPSGLVNTLIQLCLKATQKKKKNENRTALTRSYSHLRPRAPSEVFLITTVLQQCILPPLNHVFRLRVGGGMHVSVTMSALPGISRGILTEDIRCQGPCQTRWSFHYFS